MPSVSQSALKQVFPFQVASLARAVLTRSLARLREAVRLESREMAVQRLLQVVRKAPTPAVMAKLSQGYRALSREAAARTDFKGEWQLLREADRWQAKFRSTVDHAPTGA